METDRNASNAAKPAFNQALFAPVMNHKALDFFNTFAATLAPHPELDRFLSFARSYVGSGKALRALGVSIGNFIAGGEDVGHSETAMNLGAALELYQSSALVHDDFIDNAPTRRGIPSVHVQAAREIGADAAGPVAILVGDLLLSLNHLATEHSLKDLDAKTAHRISSYMAQITAEVAWGQYLDVLTEKHPLSDPEALRRYVYDVIALKSGHYSVMRPLVLGALLQDPSPHFVEMLEKIGRAWGVAFQMRDDEIGVFGDESVTGKPTGSDIREGKRTILITMALSRTTGADREFLEDALGNQNLSEEKLARVVELIESSGASLEHEKAIANLAEEGRKYMRELKLDEEREAALTQFGKVLLNREF